MIREKMGAQPEHEVMPDYNRYLREMAEVLPSLQAMADAIVATLERNVGKEESLKLADIGCGVGTGTRFYTADILSHGYTVSEAIGIDNREDAVAEAQAGANFDGTHMDFRVDNALSLETIADGSLDVCASERVIQHMTDDEARQAVAAMVRVTRPGGIVCIGGDMDCRNIRFSPQSDMDHDVVDAFQNLIKGFWRQGETSELLLDAGVTNVEVMSHIGRVNNFEQARQILRLDLVVSSLLHEGIPYSDVDSGEHALYKPSQQEIDQWLLTLQEASKAGRFSFELPFVTTVGIVN